MSTARGYSRIRVLERAGPEPVWPALTYPESRDTLDTLHRFAQIVGKTRLAFSPFENHWWHVAFYLTPRGFDTSPMPVGTRTFEIEFDFLVQQLRVRTCEGTTASIALAPRSVADFYDEYLSVLKGLGFRPRIWPVPVEMTDQLPFPDDEVHREYASDVVRRWWEILRQADRVTKQFRGRYIGKCSPVHFFWGGLDLAHTRFSGRRAPTHPGGIPNTPDFVTREGYSHECWSTGFWHGNDALPEPAFYAYAYPAPEGFAGARLKPDAAYFEEKLGEFILPYDAVRTAPNPDDVLLDFMQSAYEAAASLGNWNRADLERVDEQGKAR